MLFQVIHMLRLQHVTYTHMLNTQETSSKHYINGEQGRALHCFVFIEHDMIGKTHVNRPFELPTMSIDPSIAHTQH